MGYFINTLHIVEYTFTYFMLLPSHLILYTYTSHSPHTSPDISYSLFIYFETKDAQKMNIVPCIKPDNLERKRRYDYDFSWYVKLCKLQSGSEWLDFVISSHYWCHYKVSDLTTFFNSDWIYIPCMKNELATPV